MDSLQKYLTIKHRWYPAKRALSAMRKQGGQGPFGRTPSTHDLFTNVREQYVDADNLRILTIFIITLDKSFATNFLSSQSIMTY